MYEIGRSGAPAREGGKRRGPGAGAPSIPDGQLLPGSGCRGLGTSLRGNFASRIAAW